MRTKEDLELLREKLKSGDYDGNDIMQAWLAIDDLVAHIKALERGIDAALLEQQREE